MAAYLYYAHGLVKNRFLSKDGTGLDTRKNEYLEYSFSYFLLISIPTLEAYQGLPIANGAVKI
jgi:hypothetical protein